MARASTFALQQRVDLVEQHLEVERHHHLGVAVLDLDGELADRVEGVVVDDRAPGFEHGEEVDDERRRVRQEQADLGSLLDAEALQARRRAIHEVCDLGIRQRLAEEVRAHEASVAGGGIVEQGVKGGHTQRHAPVDAARVAAEPWQVGRRRRILTGTVAFRRHLALLPIGLVTRR